MTKLHRSVAVLALVAIAAFALPNAASAQSVPTIPAEESQPATTTTVPPEDPGAADPSGLSVSPAIVDNTVDPGASFTVPITLANITERAVPIEVSKTRLETDQVPNPAFAGRYDVSSWLAPDTDGFLLQSQANHTINIKVDVPLNAEPGGHYGTIYFGALTPASAQNAGKTVLNARVGVVFLLTVRGDVNAGARLSGPIETKTVQWDAGATNFHFGLQNTGNVHFQPQGQLVVKDLFGRKVKSLPLKPGVVLPGAELKYDVAWERGVRPGIYTAEVKIAASVDLEGKSKRFVILPLVIVIPALLILLVIVVGTWRTIAARKRRQRRQYAIEAIKSPEVDESEVDESEGRAEKSSDDEPPASQ